MRSKALEEMVAEATTRPMPGSEVPIKRIDLREAGGWRGGGQGGVPALGGWWGAGGGLWRAAGPQVLCGGGGEGLSVRCGGPRGWAGGCAAGGRLGRDAVEAQLGRMGGPACLLTPLPPRLPAAAVLEGGVHDQAAAAAAATAPAS